MDSARSRQPQVSNSHHLGGGKLKPWNHPWQSTWSSTKSQKVQTSRVQHCTPERAVLTPLFLLPPPKWLLATCRRRGKREETAYSLSRCGGNNHFNSSLVFQLLQRKQQMFQPQPSYCLGLAFFLNVLYFEKSNNMLLAHNILLYFKFKQWLEKSSSIPKLSYRTRKWSSSSGYI